MATPKHYRVTEADGTVWISATDPRVEEFSDDDVCKVLNLPPGTDVSQIRAVVTKMKQDNHAQIEELTLEESLKASTELVTKHRDHWEKTQEARKKAGLALLQGGIEPSVVLELAQAQRNHMLSWTGYRSSKNGPDTYPKDFDRNIIDKIRALPTASDKRR